MDDDVASYTRVVGFKNYSVKFGLGRIYSETIDEETEEQYLAREERERIAIRIKQRLPVNDSVSVIGKARRLFLRPQSRKYMGHLTRHEIKHFAFLLSKLLNRTVTRTQRDVWWKCFNAFVELKKIHLPNLLKGRDLGT